MKYPNRDCQGTDILKTLTNFEDSFVSATRMCDGFFVQPPF